MGVHGVIEFGNRLLTFVLVAIALACFVAALLEQPRRRSLVLLALAVGLGIPGQGVVGGITVLTDLNPWVVGLHFLLSMALVAGAYALWRAPPRATARPQSLVPRPLRQLARLTALVSAAVIVLGVIVTGSGPHAGDADAKRNGLDPATVAQAHADLVFLLIGLSVALWFALRAVAAPRAAVRAAGAAGPGRAGPGPDRLRAVLHAPAGAAGRVPHARRDAGLDRHPGDAAQPAYAPDHMAGTTGPAEVPAQPEPVAVPR